MTQFSPHAATINVLAFAPDRPSKLFSTSYDGTVCARSSMDYNLYSDRFFTSQFLPLDCLGSHSFYHLGTLLASHVLFCVFNLQVRCFDMEAQRFDLSYSTPSRTSHDYWLQHSCITDHGQGLLLGDSAGYCAAVDLRSNKVNQ